MSERERRYSKLAGAALVLSGVLRGRLSGLALAIAGGALAYRGWSGHCYCYEALGVDTSERNSATVVPARQGVKISKSISVQRSAEELFEFWRDLRNLQRVMQHVEQIDVLNHRLSHWVVSGPLGSSIEWDAEIFNEREPELIAWRSLPGGDIETAGSVHFKSLGPDRGTAVSVSLKYDPPGGKAVAKLASLFDAGLEQQLEEDLRRYKIQMEAG